ncbi:SusC/RagA family TonB-linked outer membrane protein [Coprobacter secundus]|uniref:SusC/RagA family TonB-linked outer membrane protein n=1 Tax=Coprobacter secundus subsp. similis TaxID=2751153 RepID=A0A7G1HR02_9BACT|nr:SusC/RagA family TonB-linked outer membrane protein [Coprobacter secundus]BCI62066.1 SusC/RagA family TonB-linked outer membrane protein [Coprobacter secundus subsp. similis]CCY39342.1 tonB-dependent receptor plug [Tannerella sp. CAG:118]
MRVKIYNRLRLLMVGCMLAGVCMPQIVWAQDEKPKTVVLESYVKDSQGNPIPNAVIYGNEGAKRAIADQNGRFTIKIAPLSSILVEAEGYESKIFDNPDATNGLVLDKTTYLFGKNDEVIMPFKTVEEGAVSGAVSLIHPDKVMKNDQAGTLQDLLKGYASGLMGNTNIRGYGDALILVDGLPRSADNINMEEVESISVLKDVNSVVLYGPQAQNGVIMVTTKRGNSLKRQINVKIEQGLSTVISYPEYLNSADYMTLFNEARRNDELDEQYDPALIAKYRSGENPYRYPSVDYYGGEFLRSVRSSTRAIAEFSGGNKITRYYTNVGWTSNNSLYKIGNVDGAGNNRFNVRGNVDFNITDDIKSYIDASMIIDIAKGPNGDFWNAAATYQPQYYAPLLPVSLFADPSVVEAATRVNGDYVLGGTSQYQDNVYGNLFLGGYKQTIQRTSQVNAGLEFDLHKLLQGLKLKAGLALDMYNSYDQSVNNAYAIYEPVWDDATGKIASVTKINKDEVTGVQNLGGGGMSRRFAVNVGFDYKRTFSDDHHVEGNLIGYYSTNSANGQLLLDKYAHLAIRAAYNYRHLLFADFSSALSNSIKLAPGHRIGFSPTFGLGWIISNSDFWNEDAMVDFLKLKASGGVLLTDRNFDYYLYRDAYNANGSYAYGDPAANYSNIILDVNRIRNYNLGYEKKKSLNVGVQGALLDYALTFDVNAFVTRYDGQVIKRNSYYPAYLSSFFAYENYNADRYMGFDAAISYTKKWGDFSLTAGLNMLYARSKVVVRDEVYNNAYQYRKGKPVDAIFGLQNLGFFNNDAEIASAAEQKFGTVRPGDIHYIDQNSDKVVDEEDEVMIGKSNPDFTGALHLTFKYKDFSLFIMGEGATGHDIIYNNNYYWVDGNKKYSAEVWNRWTPETAATATYPRLSSTQNDNNNRTSDFWMRKADYFSLSRVQLNYNFPNTLLRRTFIRDLSLYLRGSNLLMAAQDVKKRQLNIGSEPQFRYYALGLKVSF